MFLMRESEAAEWRAAFVEWGEFISLPIVTLLPRLRASAFRPD